MQEFALRTPTPIYRLQPTLIVFDSEVSQRSCQTDACSSSLVPQCRCKPNTSFLPMTVSSRVTEICTLRHSHSARDATLGPGQELRRRNGHSSPAQNALKVFTKVGSKRLNDTQPTRAGAQSVSYARGITDLLMGGLKAGYPGLT